jgi:N-terminal 7TM region of histidine kinase
VGNRVNEAVWFILGLLALSFVTMMTLVGRVLVQRRHHPSIEVGFFAIFAALAGFWSLGSGLELLSPALSAKIFWAKAQYLSIAFLPPVWLLFLLRYTDTGRRFQGWVYLTFIPAVATLFVVWSNEWHTLMWAKVYLEPNPFLHAVYERGPWFDAVLVPYSYLLLFSGMSVLVRALWVSTPTQRNQLWLLLVAQLVPVLANLVYLLRLSAFDLTSFGFSASSLLLGLSVSPKPHATVANCLPPCLRADA